MKTHFLFPNKYKKIGWILFISSLIMAILLQIFPERMNHLLEINVFAISNTGLFDYNKYFSFIKNSIIDELTLFGLIIGGILIGFSKLKIEDEFTSKIRYESLVWSTYLNYGLILFFTIFLYGFSYLNVLFYNTFSLLLFFIIRFHYSIYKLNKAASDDE